MEHPTAIVVNMDDHRKKGSHWITMYIDKPGFSTYFDSYGFPPTSFHHIDRLQRNCVKYKWNKRQLQSVYFSVCGQYCIVFLHYMCKRGDLNTFCSKFTNNYKKNDSLIVKLYKYVVNNKN